MHRVEIDEAQHELERAALQLEQAAEQARAALENEWAPKVAALALDRARKLIASAEKIVERELLI